MAPPLQPLGARPGPWMGRPGDTVVAAMTMAMAIGRRASAVASAAGAAEAGSVVVAEASAAAGVEAAADSAGAAAEAAAGMGEAEAAGDSAGGAALAGAARAGTIDSPPGILMKCGLLRITAAHLPPGSRAGTPGVFVVGIYFFSVLRLVQQTLDV